MTIPTLSPRPDAAVARSRPPGPRGRKLLRVARLILSDRIGVLDTVRRDYGDLVEIGVGPTRIVIVSDPDIAQSILRSPSVFGEKGLGLKEASYFLGEGLLTSSGRVWSESRVALGALFHRDRIQAMLAVTQAAADTEFDELESYAERGEPVDLEPVATRIAFSTVAAEVLAARDEERESVRADLQILSQWAERRLAVPFDRVTHLAWSLAPSARRAYRRLSARLDSPEMLAGKVGAALAQHGLTGPKLLRDHVLTLLLAGHETTSAAILWTLDLLSRHPAMADEIAEEARATPAQERGTLENKRYGRARSAVKEAMRLFPPVWVLPRRASCNTALGPYRIEAGSHVLINVHGLHRHAALWDDADRFLPARFDPARPDPPAYMPFGYGARRCVGLHLGLAETVLVVVRFLARFRLTPVGDAPPAEAGLTLHPRGGVRVMLEKRGR